MAKGVFEWEYHPGEELVLRFRPPVWKVLPDSAREHVLAARKETLLALRSLLDSAIDKAEKAEKKTKAKAKIEVE